MRIFSTLYVKVLQWSKHRFAPYYLFSLSFAEASFFPIPPDVMLAPMALAKPKSAFRYALITTLASVLGGIFGYLIGAWAFELVRPYILGSSYAETYLHVETWFTTWGFWLMFIVGFVPIPYKIFTIAAGATHISLLPFIVGSLVGRGGRFFLVTSLMLWGGKRMEDMLFRYIDRVAWVVIGFALVGGGVWYFTSSPNPVVA